MLKSIFYGTQLQYGKIKSTIIDIINKTNWDDAIGSFLMGRVCYNITEENLHLAGAVGDHHDDFAPAG